MKREEQKDVTHDLIRALPWKNNIVKVPPANIVQALTKDEIETMQLENRRIPAKIKKEHFGRAGGTTGW